MIVDWSPWHHTAGGNHNFGFVLYNGGTLYIDEGKPVPGLIETTVKNLREVATNWYFTVPKGYEALLPVPARGRAAAQHLLPAAQGALVRGRGAVAIGVRRDAGACARGLRRAHHVPDRAGLDRKRTDGDRAHVAEQGLTNMGVPVPGVELKLVPCEGKLEGAAARPQHHAGLLAPARSHRRRRSMPMASTSSVTRSGSRTPTIPARACCSTAASPRTSSSRPAPGSMSARCARACSRARALCARRRHRRRRPQRDRRADLPDLDACRRLAAGARRRRRPACSPNCAPARRLRRRSTGSSNRVGRAILLGEPPSLDAGEMTDKGSINQRAVLTRRADVVAELYAPSRRRG